MSNDTMPGMFYTLDDFIDAGLDDLKVIDCSACGRTVMARRGGNGRSSKNYYYAGHRPICSQCHKDGKAIDVIRETRRSESS